MNLFIIAGLICVTFVAGLKYIKARRLILDVYSTKFTSALRAAACLLTTVVAIWIYPPIGKETAYAATFGTMLGFLCLWVWIVRVPSNEEEERQGLY